MIKKWKTISKPKTTNFNIFSINTTMRVSPRTGTKSYFYTIHSKDWLNIIATTSENKIILIKQYRHGSNKIEVEIPGGIVENNRISIKSEALRELKEETGYFGKKAVEIGCVNPNPALFTNKCYTFLVPNVKLNGSQLLDNTEDIEVEKHSISEIEGMIKDGTITHGLVITAFYFYKKYLKTNRN